MFVNLGNVTQEEMDRLLLCNRLVYARLNRVDALKDELAINRDCDAPRLAGSQNPNHTDHLPTQIMQTVVLSRILQALEFR